MEITKWQSTKIKITEEEQNLLDDISACDVACERIVKKIVREFELSEIQKNTFWRALAKKHKLDTANKEYQLIDGVLHERDREAHSIEMLCRELEVAPLIREKVFKTFGLKE